ncbi:MAG: hypothetical protein MI744_06155, partial [Pseudomonadales bacterium]|nr:hypothetical protein [Pseudomonadales bacterium]
SIITLLSFTNIYAKKHRFIIVDESRSQLHYVDQFDSSNDWTIKFPKRYRNARLVTNQKIVMTTHDGYVEYDLKTQKELKKVANPLFNKTESLVRLPNGNTVLGCCLGKKGGISFYELDKDDKIIRKANFPEYHYLRLMSLTKDGSFLFGVANKIIKANWDGEAKEFKVSNEKCWAYEVEELSNGNYRISGGYHPALEEWTPDGTFVRKIAGGLPSPKDYNYYFFGSAQQLKNGNWVVSNWTGHEKNDSKKGVQLVEFDQEGKIVWSWHDPKRSGSVNGVIVLE